MFIPAALEAKTAAYLAVALNHHDQTSLPSMTTRSPAAKVFETVYEKWFRYINTTCGRTHGEFLLSLYL